MTTKETQDLIKLLNDCHKALLGEYIKGLPSKIRAMLDKLEKQAKN